MEAGPRPRRTRSPCWGPPALLEPKVAAAAESIPRAGTNEATRHCTARTDSCETPDVDSHSPPCRRTTPTSRR
eukprot:1544407-Pyramimonas_sp.AAC.1